MLLTQKQMQDFDKLAYVVSNQEELRRARRVLEKKKLK